MAQGSAVARTKASAKQIDEPKGGDVAGGGEAFINAKRRKSVVGGKVCVGDPAVYTVESLLGDEPPTLVLSLFLEAPICSEPLSRGPHLF